jgi:hypothetical protein
LAAAIVESSMPIFRFRPPYLRIAAALLLLLSALSRGHAEIISKAELINGRTMTQAQCAALPAVWVSAMGRSFCMRYFLSTAGGEGTRPIVFLNGDAGKITGDFNTDVRARYAERMSKEFETTMIYLGRMGLDGSSGSHRDRHTVLELQATNAALDALKKRYRFEGFHIYGHSGGAWLLGGLLGLRTDIGCAVPADGLLGAITKRNVRDPAQQLIDPSAAVGFIARNPSTRILILHDPEDRIASINNVLPFVEKLRKAGGRVEEFFVDSGGSGDEAEHHFTTGHSQLVMRDCLRGASHDEIAADLADLVAKDLAWHLANHKAKAETGAGRKPPAAAVPGAGLLLYGINLRGADYSNFSIALAEPSVCQNACRADSKCAAWTYVQPGAQGVQAHCWLKNHVPPQSQSTCCVSGVERPEQSAEKKD